MHKKLLDAPRVALDAQSSDEIITEDILNQALDRH